MTSRKHKHRKPALVSAARAVDPSSGVQVAKDEVHSLPVAEWPSADQVAWAAACRAGQLLRRGGAASHLKPITQNDLARRYGYFLDCLSRNGRLNLSAEAGAHTTAANIQLYLAEIKERLSSVTIYGSIYKMRRLTQLVAPGLDLFWLTEIENDLALVMEPRSKLDRLVQAEVLVEAGLSLMTQAHSVSKAPALTRATWFRNGLMIALLATCPIRLKNFCALELDRTFVSIKGTWWIVRASCRERV